MTNVVARIQLHKGPGTRYRSTLYRSDGAVSGLEGGSWNRIGGPVGRIPHDLAHLVVEQELGLARGLWGVLADGGLVQNADATLARQRVHLDGLRRAVGARWWHDDLTVDRFERIDAELRAAALEWDRLAPEAALARTWPAAPAVRRSA